MHTDKTIYAYVGSIPKNVQITPFACEKRNEEIEICASEKRKIERFCVWKLLEYALKERLGESVDLRTFDKQSSGKWTRNDVYFSLSHSGETVAVALAFDEVGIDVESGKDKLLRLREKILNEQEKDVFCALGDEAKTNYLAEKWTQKEAIFKAFGSGVFVPKDIDTTSMQTHTKWENDYCISLAKWEADRVVWQKVEKYL